MEFRPGLIATDLDGTLLRTDQTVSPRTAEALHRARAGGIEVVLVTGRPLRWLAEVFGQLREPVTAVCANGAVVYDPVADRTLHTAPLLPEALGEICRRLRADVAGVAFAVEVEDGRRMWYEPGFPPWEDDGQRHVRVTADAGDLCAAPAVKLLARAAGVDDSDALLATVSACLGGLAEATHSSGTGLVEISAAGVTKAAGLAWWCRRVGVDPGRVVAFGDMPNDVPMLTWAGRGVAMANAHPAARAAADDVTAANDADGVAAYLERLDQRAPAPGGR